MSSKSITVDEIQDGMVLAKDAATKDGNVLLAAGTKLQAKHASMLEKRGIKKVHVRAEEEDNSTDPAQEASTGNIRIDPALAASDDSAKSKHVQAVEKHLDQVFSDVREDKLMEELLSLAKKHAESIQLPEEPL